MPDLTIDLLASRKKTGRKKFFVRSSRIFLVLGAAIALGFFFSRDWSSETPKPEVAGTEKASRIPKDWLLRYGVSGDADDPDGDVLTNLQEYLFGTDPTKPDSDGDGESDGWEVVFGRNPEGEGEIDVVQAQDRYLESLGGDYQKFTYANIEQGVNNFFDIDREVVLEVPDDKELQLNSDNTQAGVEKYFAETKELGAWDELELQHLQQNMFSFSDAELEQYIAKINSIISLLKAVAVPSAMADVHKLRIAGLRATSHILESLRDNYIAGESNNQFWKDFFYHAVAAQQAVAGEVIVWRDVFDTLKEKGGL